MTYPLINVSPLNLERQAYSDFEENWAQSHKKLFPIVCKIAFKFSPIFLSRFSLPLIINGCPLGCPLQKKCNTWFRSSHDPSLGSVTPRGQKVISRGTPVNNFLPLWGRWPQTGVMGAPEPSVAFLLDGIVDRKLSHIFFSLNLIPNVGNYTLTDNDDS